MTTDKKKQDSSLIKQEPEWEFKSQWFYQIWGKISSKNIENFYKKGESSRSRLKIWVFKNTSYW